MSDTAIKPCPFCGAQANYSLEEDESQQNVYDTVSCGGCGAQVRALLHWAENGGEHAATLVAAWNTRTSDSDPRDEVIRRLAAELAAGSFYKESDIDRLMAERDDARAEVIRLREALEKVAAEPVVGDPASGYRMDYNVIDRMSLARAALTFAKEQLE